MNNWINGPLLKSQEQNYAVCSTSHCKIKISTIIGNVIFCIYKFTINILNILNISTNILFTICLFCLTLHLLRVHVGDSSGVLLLTVLPPSSGYLPLLVLHWEISSFSSLMCWLQLILRSLTQCRLSQGSLFSPSLLVVTKITRVGMIIASIYWEYTI